MSIQMIRGMIYHIANLEKIIWDEKGVTVERQLRWKQAADIEWWFNDLPRHIERCYVAQKKLAPKADEKVEFKGFVNYVLSDEDKGLYSAWDVDDHDLFLLAAGACQQGYKMGVSFNPKNDTFVATFMCNDGNSANAGLLLSAFAPDWYNAVKLLVFKHEVVLVGAWGDAKSQDANRWG